MLPTCRFGRYRPCRVGWACGSAKKGIAVLRLPSRRNTLRPIERPLAWLAGLALALCAGTAAGAAGGPSSVAFWYAERPPLAELSQFDWVVLEAAHLAGRCRVSERAGQHALRLSVGRRVRRRRRRHRRQRPGPGQERGPQPSLEQPGNGPRRAELAGAPAQARRGLRKQGYAGLFLDTLDSFQLQAEERREGQRRALASFSPSCIARSRASSCFQSRFRSAAGVARRRVGGGRGVDPCRLGRRCRAIPRGAPGRSRLAEGSPGCPARPGHAHRRHRLPAAGAARRGARARCALRSEGYVPFVSTPALDYLG